MTGVGDVIFLEGLRDEEAKPLESRLRERPPGPAPGAGEADISRRNAIVDDGLVVRGGAEDFRWLLGVVALKGLKLWPVSTSLVLKLGFQRGRLGTVDGGCGVRDNLRLDGVGVVA